MLAKIVEETAELVEARETLTQDEVADEVGDLLFVMANLARHLQVDPEAALRSANAKFTRRFGRIEDWLAEGGKTPPTAIWAGKWMRCGTGPRQRNAGNGRDQLPKMGPVNTESRAV